MNIRKLYRFHIFDDIFPIYLFKDGEKLRRLGENDPTIYKLRLRSPHKNGRNKRWATLYSEDKTNGLSHEAVRIPNRNVKSMVGMKV